MNILYISNGCLKYDPWSTIRVWCARTVKFDDDFQYLVGTDPEFILRELSEGLILPKIRMAIEDTDDSDSMDILHKWMSPWINIMAKREMHSILNESVLPKLSLTLDTLQITRHSFGELDSVFLWMDFMGCRCWRICSFPDSFQNGILFVHMASQRCRLQTDNPVVPEMEIGVPG